MDTTNSRRHGQSVDRSRTRPESPHQQHRHASQSTSRHQRSGSYGQSEAGRPSFRSAAPSQVASPSVGPSRIIARDYADFNSIRSSSRQYARNTDSNFGASSIRHRFGSEQNSANPSPGPGYSWRAANESSRRSVAVASVSGRDADNASYNFSLAGPAPMDTIAVNQPYIDPGYTQLNPAYDQPVNVRPVWGLAKPLPHVLRPGMVPTSNELQEELDKESEELKNVNVSRDLESGRIEPVLRPDKISSQLDHIRREREISLFRAWRQQHHDSPDLSPFEPRRRSSDADTETPVPYARLDNTIDEEGSTEDEEDPHSKQQNIPELALPQLQHAIEGLDQAKKDEELLKPPYLDAVPLPAYQAGGDEVHNLHTYWSVVRLRFREPLAEFLAITVQLTIGFSVNLSATVSHGTTAVGDTGNWAWGLATMVAIYIAGGISGAHLNPAISLMLYIYRGFPLSKVPAYVAAQMVGAFLASLIAFGLFQPGLIASQDTSLTSQTDNRSTGLILTPALLSNFLTFPRASWVTTSTAFFTELAGTTILAVSVLALGDDTNAPPGAGMNAFIVGLLVTVLGMAFGYNTGLAMNPARDFGPRVAMFVLGYGQGQGPSLFADGYWFRVAWLGPLAGAVLGGFLYDAAIFVGGETPVNYPTTRIKRAATKWRERWRKRISRTKKKVIDVKNDITGAEYEPVAR